MNKLVFDTCLDKMYVTIENNENILSSKVVETTKEHYHSAFLISTIIELLKSNNIEPKDIAKNIDLIATNVGPGSFTGIRACMTVARVFAQAHNINVIGVSSLEILSKINNTDKKTLVALDARKEMAYVAIFDGNKELLEPQTMLLEELKELINKDDYFIVTDNKLQPILGGLSYQQNNLNLGENLVQIAYEKFKNGADTKWQNLRPLYIQPPPVTVAAKK